MREISNQFKWITIFRLIAVTVIVGSGVYFLKSKELLFLIIVSYALTFVYFILFNKNKMVKQMLWISTMIDVIIVSEIIYFTGKGESDFYFLYFFPIIAGSILFSISGGIITAILSIITYAFILNIFIGNEAYYQLYLHATFTFLLASIASYLSERIKEIKFSTNTIIKNIKSGILVFDNSGNILYENDNVKKMVEVDKIKQNILNFGNGFHEINYKDKIIGVNVSLLTGRKGQYIGKIFELQDITELQIKEKFATIGRFAGDLAHEIRNPIAVLQGACELIQKGVDENEKSILMKRIIEQNQKLNKIITNFLSFAKPIKLNLERKEIGEIINKTIDLLGVKNSVEFINNDKVYLIVDEEKIMQAFGNIIKNGIEAMNSNGKLRIEVIPPNKKYYIMDEVKISKKDEVVVCFTDYGNGIPDEDITKIFTPLYTTKKDGIGLGLNITVKIIDEHKGKIEVKSKLGKGTTFAVHLPQNYQNVDL